MADPEEVTRMTVRFPVALYAELAAWAREEDRSLHAQVLYLLRQLVAARARKRSRAKTAA